VRCSEKEPQILQRGLWSFQLKNNFLQDDASYIRNLGKNDHELSADQIPELTQCWEGPDPDKPGRRDPTPHLGLPQKAQRHCFDSRLAPHPAPTKLNEVLKGRGWDACPRRAHHSLRKMKISRLPAM
jgi:hypothetical protein